MLVVFVAECNGGWPEPTHGLETGSSPFLPV